MIKLAALLVAAMAVGTAAGQSLPSTPSAPVKTESTAARPAGLDGWATEFLRKYADPQKRQELLKHARANTREVLEGFDAERKLDPATFEKLVQLSADLHLESQVLRVRCRVLEPGRDCAMETRELQDRRRQAVTELLGPGGYEASQRWMEAFDERRMVASLARRMPPDQPLSEAQSRALVKAFSDEQALYFDEARSAPQPPTRFGNADRMEVFYNDKAATKNDRMASARGYSQRMRDRAATVLKVDQAVIFNQMQDNLLADLHDSLEPDDRDALRRENEARYRKYFDPEQRKDMRAKEARSLRAQLNGFEKRRNLDAATFEELIDLLADQQLDRNALTARCAGLLVDPNCDYTAEANALRQRHEQAVASLIGAGGFKAAETWKFSPGERQMVSRIASRMPANLPLTQTQIYELADALAGVKWAAFEEPREPGMHLFPFRNDDGMEVMYIVHLPAVEARLASGRKYSQRIRESAATVMIGEQLDVFNQIQDKLMADFERYQRTQWPAIASPPGS